MNELYIMSEFLLETEAISENVSLVIHIMIMYLAGKNLRLHIMF